MYTYPANGFINIGEAPHTSAFAIRFHEGQTVSLSSNGSVTFSGGYRPCASATAFWTHFAAHNRCTIAFERSRRRFDKRSTRLPDGASGPRTTSRPPLRARSTKIAPRTAAWAVPAGRTFSKRPGSADVMSP